MPLLLALSLSLAACANQEFSQVKTYKEFLNQAKPSLQGMNKVRTEMMMNADSIDTMLVKFEAGLLPNVQQLHDLVDKQAAPTGRLGEIHGTFKQITGDYLAATKQLVERLKAAKAKNADDEIERAILEWGAKDKVFGEQMGDESQGLVRDLTEYLDNLVKS
jgi:hypothetical protein